MSCGSDGDIEKEKDVSISESDTGLLKIDWSKNIETMALIYNLSIAGDELFLLNPEPRSMLARALTDEFLSFKNHKAVLLLNALIDEGFVDLYDIDLANYMTDLPEFNQYADFPEVYYEWDSLSREQVQERFDEFHAAVREFYTDAKLESYFENKRKSLYEKLMSEVNSIRPSEQYCYEMEKYYGIQHSGYYIIVSAFSFNGIGRSKVVSTKKGDYIYQLVTSDPRDESDTIDLADLNSFNIGYINKDYFREISIHEMGHAFFNDGLSYNESIRQSVLDIEYLFTDSLKKSMAKQGYYDWPVCFEEHLVRVGEIKIARILNDDLFAKEYYQNCVEERGFIYLPKLDTLFLEYENNRNLYPTITDFLPDLIELMK